MTFQTGQTRFDVLAPSKEPHMDYPDFYYKGPAPCTKADPEIFFAEPDQSGAAAMTRQAKGYCNGCPYREECLAWAVLNNEVGVWGGTSGNERRRIRRNSYSKITNGRVRSAAS